MSKTKTMANFAAIASQLLLSVIAEHLVNGGNATHECGFPHLLGVLLRELFARIARGNTGIGPLAIPLTVGQAEALALRDGLDFATLGEEGGDQVVRVRFHELNIGPP